MSGYSIREKKTRSRVVIGIVVHVSIFLGFPGESCQKAMRGEPWTRCTNAVLEHLRHRWEHSPRTRGCSVVLGRPSFGPALSHRNGRVGGVPGGWAPSSLGCIPAAWGAQPVATVINSGAWHVNGREADPELPTW